MRHSMHSKGGAPDITQILAENHSSPESKPNDLPSTNRPHGMADMLQVDKATGSAIFTYPLQISSGRRGMGPEMTLQYDSRVSNGPFGLGWSTNGPTIHRRADKQVPTYDDSAGSDIFSHSVFGDLVPRAIGNTMFSTAAALQKPDNDYIEYVPQKGTTPVRIQQGRNPEDGSITGWRVTTEENVTYTFGTLDTCRILNGEALATTGIRQTAVWLLDNVYDSHGNCLWCEYKAEDSAGVDILSTSEANRDDLARGNNKYLTSIKYANRTPNREPGTGKPLHPSALPADDWLMELCLDYGQYPTTLTSSSSVQTRGDWAVRPDPFSTYRFGFEVRSYRLCRRVLMFHHMREETGLEDLLISATELAYCSINGLSTIQSMQHRGYGDGDVSMVTPPITLTYTGQLEASSAISGDLPGEGFNGSKPTWVSLHGDGVVSLISRNLDAWYSLPTFNVDPDAEALALPRLPNASGMLYDMNGDGLPDLVVSPETNQAGFFSGTGDKDAGWGAYKSIPETLSTVVPNTATNVTDLTGRGNDDLLFIQGDYLAWAESLGQEGFTAPSLVQPTARTLDGVARGPQIIMSDPSQAVHLADMTGDGVSDLVRVRSGEVCYWPNLGNGRFGTAVLMDDAPVFSNAVDGGSLQRILLLDVDTSGFTDLVYLSEDGDILLYLNLGGERWSDPLSFEGLPPLDQVARVAVTDILGNGTSAIIWSSEGSPRMFFMDLCGGVRPRLLSGLSNGRGLEMVLKHDSTSKMAQQDRLGGNPWLTTVPMALFCVTRLEERDAVTGRRFIQAYTYRHGYYDSQDREFRGFALVETRSWHELTADPSINDGPVLKTAVTLRKQWFSTGQLLDFQELDLKLSPEYFTPSREYDVSLTTRSVYIPLSSVENFPNSPVDSEDLRVAYRVLSGRVLRNELYTADGSASAGVPVMIECHSFTITHQQAGLPSIPTHRACFTVHSRETIKHVVERRENRKEWRTEQTCILAVDGFLNILALLKIAYGKDPTAKDNATKTSIAKVQGIPTMLLVKRNFTNSIIDVDSFHVPMESESRTYRFSSIVDSQVPGAAGLWDATALLGEFQEIPFGQEDSQPGLSALINHVRTFYASDSFETLPLGVLESHALPSHHFTKVFGRHFLESVFEPQKDMTPVSVSAEEIAKSLAVNGHVQDESGDWWLPSPKTIYAGPGDTVSDVERRFLVDVGTEDGLGNFTSHSWDNYSLLSIKTVSPTGLAHLTSHSYAALAAVMEVDENGNITAFVHDALHRQVASLMAGKDSDAAKKFLSSFPVPDEAQVNRFLQSPAEMASDILGGATSLTLRRPYPFQSGKPDFVASISRKNTIDVEGDRSHPIYISISHLSGDERVVDLARLAEPEEHGSPSLHWSHTPWVVSDALGHPVKVFEAAFTSGPEPLLSPTGRATTYFRDSLGRTIGTILPDRSWTKVDYQPWKVVHHDPSDLVLGPGPSEDAALASQCRSLCVEDENNGGWMGFQGRDADRARKLAGITNETPSINYLNSTGEIFAVDQTAKSEQNRLSLHLVDFQGCRRKWVSPRGSMVVQLDVYDMAGRQVRRSMADADTQWTLHDANGHEFLRWRDGGHRFNTSYDSEGRKTSLFWQDDSTRKPITIETLEYADGSEGSVDRNIAGKLHRVSDQSGERIFARRDAGGNITETSQALTASQAGWEDVTAAKRVGPSFVTTSGFDLAGRTCWIKRAGYLTTYQYNARGFVQSVTLDGVPGGPVKVVASIEYDATGRTLTRVYGNGAQHSFAYEHPLRRLSEATVTSRTDERLDRMQYSYDTVGNILSISKENSNVLAREVVDSQVLEYDFDAFHQVIRSTGREIVSIRGPIPFGSPGSADSVAVTLPLKEDTVLAQYEELFEYDLAGNLSAIEHRFNATDTAPWNRELFYASDSNHLDGTKISSNGTSIKTPSSHDKRGNTTQLGDGQTQLAWDPLNQLSFIKSVESRTSYIYDNSGWRSRRTMRDYAIEEDVQYFDNGNWQIRTSATSKGLDHETTVLAVEVPDHLQPYNRPHLFVYSVKDSRGGSETTLRYQIRDHLQSAYLELDGVGNPVSFEEYSAYGYLTLRATSSDVSAAATKLEGYNGKELDGELAYYGRRYYAPSLGRWASIDPIGIDDGLNVLAYVRGNPVGFFDRDGSCRGAPPFNYNAAIPGHIYGAPVANDKWKNKQKPIEGPPPKFETPRPTLEAPREYNQFAKASNSPQSQSKSSTEVLSGEQKHSPPDRNGPKMGILQANFDSSTVRELKSSKGNVGQVEKGGSLARQQVEPASRKSPQGPHKLEGLTTHLSGMLPPPNVKLGGSIGFREGMASVSALRQTPHVEKPRPLRGGLSS